MNKNICLLLLGTMCVMSMAADVETPVVKASILGWIMNTYDFWIALLTITYCFEVGNFNIFYLNDGGASLYQCLNNMLKNIEWNPWTPLNLSLS